MRHAFAEEFVLGVATSAAQIEGGWDLDGRGQSIWDRFAAQPGNIADGSTPKTACDHYHLWQADIELLRWLGVDAYRFSIAWPRVQPVGTGPANAAGLDFYDALVDRLLELGIQPFVTLYHWDLPEPLQTAGGWSNRATAQAFVDYTALVVGRLGDRVRHWITHNEPWCAAHLGYEAGHHAPGWTDPAASLRAAHHLLLSHGWATQHIRNAATSSEVGITLILSPAQPASASAADQQAAELHDGSMNYWYLEPVFHGRYPKEAVLDRVRHGHLQGENPPFVEVGDLATIATPLDFLGINYYSRTIVAAGPDGQPRALTPNAPLTDMGWEVYPEGMEAVLVRLTQEYDVPKIYITENGAAFTDPPGPDGRISDQRRIDFLHHHLAAAARSMRAGVPLAGYFVWSLMDNFEWAHGYTKRFGLYDVNFATQRRTPRDSAYWYRDVIARRAIEARAAETR